MRAPRLNRRDALTALTLAGATLAGAPGLHAQADAKAVFRHGVASGDPDQTSLVIWTRIAPADAPETLEWEVAADAAFVRIVAAGTVQTNAAQDFTVKVVVDQLQPGTIYHYRFRARGEGSPAGRTRTLPDGTLDALGIALVSCSNFPFGYFNGYDAIARDPLVDFVLHTGDYIYEYGADGWGAESGKALGRAHEPAHEIVSLTDYRTRHAQYRGDAALQAMTAMHPLIVCWDDHESANNPWVGGAQNHQPAEEGSWLRRRQASIRAYYEWMPIREPGAGRNRAELWRSYRFGDLATLVTLETRHTARAEQIDYLDYGLTIQTEADARKLREEVIGAPDRPLLSAAMEDRLTSELTRSVGAGEPWRLIGNPMPIARMPVPDLIGAGLLPEPTTPGLSQNAQALAWKAKWALPFYTDTWDGYPWARERFYALCQEAGARDLIMLTGDSHSFWANSLRDADSRAMGVELGTAGISSPGDFLDSGFGEALAAKLDGAFAAMLDEVEWTDNFHQGYVRLDLRRDQARARFIGLSTITSPHYQPITLRDYQLVPTDGSLTLELAPPA